jgi:predicted RNA-binding Zn-ribbon protein involved in translation (DUF1610 family)
VAAATCSQCGALLPAVTGDEAERADLEAVDVARAVSTEGFDTEFTVGAGVLVCPACGTSFRSGDDQRAGIPVEDTGHQHDATVLTMRCPKCGTPGHAVLPRER